MEKRFNLKLTMNNRLLKPDEIRLIDFIKLYKLLKEYFKLIPKDIHLKKLQKIYGFIGKINFNETIIMKKKEYEKIKRNQKILEAL